MRKNGVPKVVKLTLSRNMSKQKQSENAENGTQKKCVEKNGLKWKWKETRKEDQSKIGPSHDEKWSLV